MPTVNTRKNTRKNTVKNTVKPRNPNKAKKTTMATIPIQQLKSVSTAQIRNEIKSRNRIESSKKATHCLVPHVPCIANADLAYRSKIQAQNFMVGDEFVMYNESNIYVTKVTRNEDLATVRVTFSNGMRRKYIWGRFAMIMETRSRNLYRRNSLRRNGYRPNYLLG